MERIDEFTRGGRQFIYFDLSKFKSNGEFTRLTEAAKPIIAKYAEKSVYTITNIEGVSFDSETKEIVARWTAYNKPYVKYGAVIGVDGIKKIMVNAIFKLSGRNNMVFLNSKEHAIKWLLEKGDKGMPNAS